MDSSELNVYSRRDFGKIVLAGLPLSLVLQKPDSKINGVQIGAITYSFRTHPEPGGHHQGVRRRSASAKWS